MKLEILYLRTGRPRGQAPPEARASLLRAGWQRVHPGQVFPTDGWPEPGQGPWQLPDRAFSFSFSHADGLSVLACTRQGRIGADVAHTQETALAQQLGADFFSPTEQVALAEGRLSRLQLWTRKEAVLKAAGCGLLLDPVEAEVSGPTCLVLGTAYRLHAILLLDDYELALAAEAEHDPPEMIYTEVGP